MGAEEGTPSAPAGTALPMNSCRNSAAKRSSKGSRCRFLSTAGASDWPMAMRFLLITIRFSMCSQNSGVSQSGTSGKMRAVVLLVSMITCLQSHCRLRNMHGTAAARAILKDIGGYTSDGFAGGLYKQVLQDPVKVDAR